MPLDHSTRAHSFHTPYDGSGQRIKKKAGNETTIFVYDAMGKMVAEYTINAPTNTDPQISYLTTDTLGTPRINTNANGEIIARHDYMPFGEEIIGLGQRSTELGYNTDGIRKKFTQYDRDEETGFDYAKARYYSNVNGRFASPDPYIIVFEMERGEGSGKQIAMLYEYLVQTQNWNKYTYCLNNPLKFSDPIGMRPPSYWEKKALEKLDQLIEENKGLFGGDTDLSKALADAKKEISGIIDGLGENERDRGIDIAVVAILEVGNDAWRNDKSKKIDDFDVGGKTSFTVSGYKCNAFVAFSVRKGPQMKFIRNGANGIGFPLINRKPPAANWLGDSRDTKKLTNLPIIKGTLRPGDIVAWRYDGGADDGHSAIHIGGGVVAYAGSGNGFFSYGGTPEVRTLSDLDGRLSSNHEPYVVRRAYTNPVRRVNGKP